MAVYKTPGVYVEEIPNLPASIVPVETAIPAFVGYTEKAERGGKSIRNVPTTVSSLLDFRRYFGAGPKLDDIEVVLDNNNVTDAKRKSGPRFRLFDSLRLFWDNGGGDAIIVSVGDFKGGEIDPTKLGDGIDVLRKVDRPTMILFPDGVDLDTAVLLGDLQAKTLMQCNDLQDRVGVFDFQETGEDDWQDDVDAFRNRVGNQNLKYGAVYGPHLITSYPIDLGFRHISFKDKDNKDLDRVGFLKDTLANGDPAFAKTIDALNGAKNAANTLDSHINSSSDPTKALANQWGALLNTLGPTATASKHVFEKAFNFLADQLKKLDGWATQGLGDSPRIEALRIATDRTLENLAETCVPGLIALHNLLATKPAAAAEATAAEAAAAAKAAAEAAAAEAAAATEATAAAEAAAAEAAAAEAAAAEAAATVATAAPDDLAAAEAAAAQTTAAAEAAAAKAAAAKAAATEATTAAEAAATEATAAAEAAAGATAAAEAAAADKLCDYAAAKYNLSAKKQWGLENKDLTKPADAFATETTDHDDKLGATWAELRHYTVKVIDELFGKIVEAMKNIHGAAVTLEAAHESRLRETLPQYAAIVDSSIRQLQRMPPSGAIAGIYAQVDNARGVWKAPANVSVNQVQGLTRSITAKQQENLNVDADSGKSINAIRFFHGKGHLVWGARTLMGNDNEWRYVSVRRYYNFVEESVAKAMAPVVFEPNDATTWVRVKTMIENFLLGQWRQGALMGSKPDQAFFVNVGLNVTMTPIDVLEGRLIIVVGMSVVRPAEFIILRFMHMLPAA
jgi:phage tail sheath protein FI